MVLATRKMIGIIRSEISTLNNNFSISFNYSCVLSLQKHRLNEVKYYLNVLLQIVHLQMDMKTFKS